MEICLLVLLSALTIAHCVFTLYFVKLIKMILSYSFPWEKLEQLGNGKQIKTGFSFTEASEQSTTLKKSAEVAELPPEVVAPGLKKMRKTSGF